MARRTNPPCKGCPPNPKPPASIKVAEQPVKLDPIIVNNQSEGQRLWKHVLFGTGTCVGMLEGYLKLGVPGNPLPGLLDLQERINNLVNQVQHED